MKIPTLLLSSSLACLVLLTACNDKDKVNNAPVGIDANLTTQADTPLTGTLMGSDVDGNRLTYAVATQPSQGTLMVNAKGSFVYTPTADTTGTDQFTFTVSDGKLVSTPATANITINPLDVSFSSYSRTAFAQMESDQPLPLNTRNVEANVSDETAYDDLLQ
jgi:VCBS repeat-containing protein